MGRSRSSASIVSTLPRLIPSGLVPVIPAMCGVSSRFGASNTGSLPVSGC